MRVLLLIGLSCLLSRPAPAGAQTAEYSPTTVPGFPTDPAQAAVATRGLEREAAGLWSTRIAWRKTAKEALAEARRSGKPLLVFFVVSELGRKTAEHC